MDGPLNSRAADVLKAVALREAIYELVWAPPERRDYDRAAVTAVTGRPASRRPSRG